MSVSLEYLGRMIGEMRADMRDLRTAHEQVSHDAATRQQLDHVAMRMLNQFMALSGEASLTRNHITAIEARLDSLERTIADGFARLAKP
jgi:chemotaxis protein histidine kinase CheA